MSDEEVKMIAVVDDRLWKSVGRDVVSFATLVGMVGLGVLLNSSALQWIGAILWFLVLIGRSSSFTKKMTIAEARRFLTELEGRQQ